MKNRNDSLYTPITSSLHCYLSKIAMLLVAMLYCYGLNGQCTPQLIPTIACQNAPLLCLNQFCYETSLETDFCCNGFCGGNTIVNNPQYFLFIPSLSTVEIHIHVDNCTGGSGLQGAIIDACPWSSENVIGCDPGTGPGGTMILNASVLIPGNFYWLLIDGSNGSICDYTIEYVSGINLDGFDLNELLPELTFASDSVVVPGYTDLVVNTGPHDPNVGGYYWIREWNQQDTMTSGESQIYIPIPCDLAPGTWSICVRSYNGCDVSEEVCIDIMVEELPTGQIDTSVICPEEFPIMWLMQVINGPGEYVQTYTSEFGCSFDSTWVIESYISFPGQETIELCNSSFEYEGHVFNESGIYTVALPGLNMNGCDSIVILQLTLDSVGVFIESACVDSMLTLIPHVFYQDPAIDTLIYTWYDCGFETVMATSISYVPDSLGCYCLIIDHGMCADTLCSTYLESPCESSCSLVRESGCISEPFLFSYDGQIAPGSSFHWLIDLPGAPASYFGGNDSITLYFDSPGCYGVTLTIEDSSSTFSCRDSFCVTELTSTASICCDVSICDTCITLEINLTGAAPWTLYLNDGTTTDTIAGVIASPYFHTVCPPMDDPVTYSLSVSDNFNLCPAMIVGNGAVTIELHTPPAVSIVQIVDTLCAHPPGMAAYRWYQCPAGSTISTSACFAPSASGCYCVEVTTEFDCVNTACYNIILTATTEVTESLPQVYPIPSKGNWTVNLSNNLKLPVQWTLYDLFGRLIESGKLEQSSGMIALANIPVTGMYLLQLKSSRNQVYLTKVLIQ